MLNELSVGLATSAIYDFGKSLSGATAGTETVQTVLKKPGLKASLHDFPARYVEVLVELRLQKKSKTLEGI